QAIKPRPGNARPLHDAKEAPVPAPHVQISSRALWAAPNDLSDFAPVQKFLRLPGRRIDLPVVIRIVCGWVNDREFRHRGARIQPHMRAIETLNQAPWVLTSQQFIIETNRER